MKKYHEIESAVGIWYYGLPIIASLISGNLFFLIFIPFLYIISKYIHKINIKLTAEKIIFKTAVLTHRGSISFNEIKSIEKTEFPIMFEMGNLKIYKYPKSSSISDIEFGITIYRNNGEATTIATRNPEKLISIINEKIKNS